MLQRGITYMHEHTTINLSALKGSDDTNLDCYEQTVAEFKKLRDKGVRNIVDVTVLGMFQNPDYVQKVAEESALNIISSTGFYTQRFFPDFVSTGSAEKLADFMINEISQGIGGSTIKARLIGEIGSSKDGFTADEEKVFKAAVIAHKETGVNITTHATLGTFADGHAAFFASHGLDLSKVLIGHVDLSGDTKYILDILKTGVYVGFDTVGKENYMPDMTRVEMLKEIQEAGYIGQVVLSMDITRKSNMEFMGGIGYSYLLDTFVPLMRSNGIHEESIEKMLIENPARFFDS